jgi:hypothetical protein
MKTYHPFFNCSWPPYEHSCDLTLCTIWGRIRGTVQCIIYIVIVALGECWCQLRPSLLPSQAIDVRATCRYYDCIITVATSQLRPIATVKWGHIATVPLRSSENTFYLTAIWNQLSVFPYMLQCSLLVCPCPRVTQISMQ